MTPKIVYRDMGPNLLKELPREYSQEHEGLTKLMFPSQGFHSIQPPYFDRLLLERMNNVWSKQLVRWRFKFDPTSEKNIAQWLNSVGEEFSRVTGIPIKRKWVADTCNLGNPPQSKADIVLVDYASSRTNCPTWGNIHAFGEVMNQSTFDSMTKRIVNTKTGALFAAQETRRFVPSFAINGGKGNGQEGPQLTLSLIDREGVLFQNVNMRGGVVPASALLRIIAGFMCGDSVGLGYDPTVTLDANGKVDTITVEGLTTKSTYRVLKTLHVARGYQGYLGSQCRCTERSKDTPPLTWPSRCPSRHSSSNGADPTI